MFLKTAAYQILRFTPDSLPFNYAFAQAWSFLRQGKFLSPRKPQTFNDYLLRNKLSAEWACDLKRRVTDKFELKTFVEERLGAGFTPRTYAVLETPEQVRNYVFPAPSVVKPTHTSGKILFVDAEQPDDNERAKIVKWLNIDHFVKGREPNYKNMKRRIIVEERLNVGGPPPDDLKVFCFHGLPRLILVNFRRETATTLRTIYDIDGRRLPVRCVYPVAEIDFPCPELLPKIGHVSAALSADFDFVRTDLYADGGRLYVGELTFFPGNCCEDFSPRDFNVTLGQMFCAPIAQLPMAAK